MWFNVVIEILMLFPLSIIANMQNVIFFQILSFYTPFNLFFAYSDLVQCQNL